MLLSSDSLDVLDDGETPLGTVCKGSVVGIGDFRRRCTGDGDNEESENLKLIGLTAELDGGAGGTGSSRPCRASSESSYAVVIEDADEKAAMELVEPPFEVVALEVEEDVW